VIATRAFGSYIQGEAGELWIDATSGIFNVSLGHGHSVVRKALQDAAWVNTHTSPSKANIELRERLAAAMPEYPIWHLVNTGSEAIEKAIQCASVIKGRQIIVGVLPYSFHGKSLTLATTRYAVDDQVSLVPWGRHFPIRVIEDIDRDPFDVLLWEPVQGWAGKRWDERLLRAACDQRGALLIADEMLTGFLRCGKWLLSETADIVVAGKGLAQGMPLAVIGLKEEVELPCEWSTTAGGNNVCASVGVAVLQHLESDLAWLESAIEEQAARLGALGFVATGALGFLKVSSAAHVKEILRRHRIITNWHDDILRLGPRFEFEHRAHMTLKSAMEEASPWL